MNRKFKTSAGQVKMAKNDKNSPFDELDIPLPSSADLRGRQSVRATFKLSPRAIDVLSIVATHLGIKQKSLFDHLIEDAQSLSTIANEIEYEAFGMLDRIQKTFVVSRRTLSSLEETSRKFDTPRDALVEYSIQRLLPVIAKERERHRRRKAILKDINAHLAQGLKILQKAQTQLGEEDPVCTRFEAAMHSLVSAQNHIEIYVEKGSVIEDF
jgi:LmbE family N-acetylglucosaminyl deacetylase